MKNSGRITNNGNCIPGLSALNAHCQLNRERKQKENLVGTRDSSNRKYVRDKILEYIEDGLTKEEILEKVVNDPIMKEFEYLTTSGTKIEVFVNNWIEDAIKKANSKDEKTR